MAKLYQHHIVPRHVGGTDDPSNLVYLTLEEHAEAHHKLYEEHGRKQDYIAWKALTGQITHEEATIEAIKARNTDYMKTPYYDEVRQRQTGKPKKESTRLKMIKPKSESHKANMRKPKDSAHAAKLNEILNARIKCDQCDYESTKSAVARHKKKHHV